MRISRISIQNFRSLKIVKDIPLEKDITLLLGKNESGKTNFLQALNWFSTDDPLENDDKCSYGIQDEAEVSIIFKFENETECKDIDFLDTILKIDDTFKVVKKADGTKKVLLNDKNVNIQPTVNVLFSYLYEFIDLIGQQKSLTQADINLFENLKTFRKKRFNEIVNIGDKTADQDVESDNKIISSDLWKKITNEIIEKLTIQPFQNKIIETARIELIKKLNKIRNDTMGYVVNDFLPKVVYFSDVNRIGDSVSISSFNDKDIMNKTFVNLARLVNLDIKNLALKQPKERQKETKDASTRISGLINDSWKQEEVGVSIRADGDNLLIFIEDESVSFELPSRRSEGFQYFLSFYINFMAETQYTLKNSIILLDDPGVRLHPAGQKDLMETMKKIAINNQIIIATHSPFLIDKTNLRNIRIVEKHEQEGTKIAEKFYNAGEDAYEPIRAALGVTIGDSLFTSPYNVIVEGISDHILLYAVFQYLKSKEDIKFKRDELGIFPAQGATKIPYFTTIFEKERYNYLLILDNDTSGRKVKQELNNNDFIDSTKIYLLSDIIKTFRDCDCEIEDLLSPKFYLSIVKESYAFLGVALDNLTLEAIDVDQNRSSKITSKLSKFFSENKIGKFDKILVAKSIASYISTPADSNKLENEFIPLIDLIKFIENHFYPKTNQNEH